jgi:hypothetical protein
MTWRRQLAVWLALVQLLVALAWCSRPSWRTSPTIDVAVATATVQIARTPKPSHEHSEASNLPEPAPVVAPAVSARAPDADPSITFISLETSTPRARAPPQDLA